METVMSEHLVGGKQQAIVTESARPLLREIHHQVKNNLQIVCSLLRIQSRGLVEADARAVCKRSEERIQCMALVYDALYRGSLEEGVSLRDYLPTMVRHLVQGMLQTAQTPEVAYTLDPIQLSSKAATHVGLMLNEVLSHRLRQQRLGDGSLSIELAVLQEADGTVFRICDNGPPHDESRGILPIEHQILDALVRQLEGKASYPYSDAFQMIVHVPTRALNTL
jgi:two-component sensor histidine kinase